jgi:hypothetical protein
MMGILSLPLMLWDIHNGAVIASMGMAWDTGPPIWPYQASDILLRFLNGPAYSIAMPIANFLKLAAPRHHLLVFLAILIWWWFLGFTLDRGSAWKKAHWRWPLMGMLAVLIALFLWTAVAADALRLWSQAGAFRPPSTLLILRFLCPATWFITLASLLVGATRRVLTR